MSDEDKLITDKVRNALPNEVRQVLMQFTPGQRAMVEALATSRIEREMLQKQVAVLSDQHQDLFNVLLTILAYLKEEGVPELRIHKSQFKRLREQWRIDRWLDEETDEHVFKLLTIYDEMMGRKGQEEPDVDSQTDKIPVKPIHLHGRNK